MRTVSLLILLTISLSTSTSLRYDRSVYDFFLMTVRPLIAKSIDINDFIDCIRIIRVSSTEYDNHEVVKSINNGNPVTPEDLGLNQSCSLGVFAESYIKKYGDILSEIKTGNRIHGDYDLKESVANLINKGQIEMIDVHLIAYIFSFPKNEKSN